MRQTKYFLTELAGHLRKVVKANGVAARVRVAPGGGSVQIFPVAYGVEFSDVEQRAIRMAGIANRLTLVRGLPIVLDQMTDAHGVEFYLPAGTSDWDGLYGHPPGTLAQIPLHHRAA